MSLNTLTVLDAITGLKSGKFTTIDLVNACYEQIEKFDGHINAFITLTKDKALKSAQEADNLIKEKGSEVFKDFPLLGIPYACKDNFSTKGVTTTASSNVLKNYVPPFNSTVVERLDNAGAILLGKTNMDAFAHGSSNETSDFFDTKNPWDLTRAPGGSSGGSASAVASNMCLFATGSETAGSIRGPASWCGITGLKPSYGRVSRYGVVAMASSTDSPGPLTKDVLDASYILEVIAGNDPNDATSSPIPLNDYLHDARSYSLKGKKIGLPKSYFDLDIEEGYLEKIKEAVEVYKNLGAEIVEMDLMDPKYSIGVYTILQRSEVSSNLARLDGIRYGDNRDSFGFEAKKRMMLGAYALSSGYYDAYYSKAQRVRTLLVEDMKKAFKQVDLILAPTMPGIAVKLGESAKDPMFGEMMDVLNEQSSIAGNCAIAIPCGFYENMPVGFMLVGDLFKESEVIGAAHAYQLDTDHHKKFVGLKEKLK